MTIQFNHTLIHAHDKEKSAAFLTEILGLPPARAWGPFMAVELDNGVSLDFVDAGGMEFDTQHYAFLIGEPDFDAVFARIQGRGLSYWADPFKRKPGEINRHDGGRGVYFDDPDGHLLEVLTRPYGETR
jgi:catechol 2,3-dioxygenase-like lactoylglutathione lyase family enzyme